MARRLVRRIEQTALVLGGLATAASAISLDPEVVGGVFLGAAVGWLNLAVVRLLFERGARTPERGAVVLASFMVKSVLLLGLVATVVLLTGVNGVAFIAGFSSSVLAIMVVPVIGYLMGHGPGQELGAEGAERDGGAT